MKVTEFSYMNFRSNRSQKATFGKGLTNQMMQEIQNANISEISNKLSKNGIANDFKDNKVIAWCCEKTFDIFKYLNTNFKTKLALPKGIYVEDFKKLNINNTDTYGFCNLTPSKLQKDSAEITRSRTLFFNNFPKINFDVPQEKQWQYDWNNIDKISDYRYLNRQAGTDFFLDIFLHEFAHASHEDKLLKKLGKAKLFKILNSINNNEFNQKYKNHIKKTSQICDYASNNPLEAIACDMSKVISNKLDKTTLIPNQNPFISTPYENLSFWKRQKIKAFKHSNTDESLNNILRNYWNGKFSS